MKDKPHRVLAGANLCASKLVAKLGDSELGWILADRAMASAMQIDDLALYAVASGQAAISRTLGHDGNQLWTAFGPTNVELHRIAVAVSFEQPDRAITTAERLDTGGLPESLVSRRAQLHLDLAAAYHQMSDGDPSAVLHLIEAERIAPQVIQMNHNARGLIVDLVRRERRSATPGLRPLAQRAGVDI